MKNNEENMKIYEALRHAPQEALKTIMAGRLKGMSDINPVWRIEMMTRVFGPCGIGWKYEIVKQWMEAFDGEIKAFTNINLYVKIGGEWSEAIPGTGGSSFVSNEKQGKYVNDECYKMSLTDALSVSMKNIGMAADIYFSKGASFGTKYEMQCTYSSTKDSDNVTNVPNNGANDPIKEKIMQCQNIASLSELYKSFDKDTQNKYTHLFSIRKEELKKWMK